MCRSLRVIRFGIWAAAGLVVMLAASTISLAQQDPAVDPAPVAFDEQATFQDYVEQEATRSQVRARINQHMGMINDVMQGRTFIDDGRPQLDQWFKGFIYPRMTQVGNLGQLDQMRLDFFKRYFVNVQFTTANGNLPAHDYLVQMTLAEMQKIVEGNYHPAARYNALLVIGRLNDRESVAPNGARVVPKPSAQALGFMVNQLQAPNQMDALRLGAWVGVLRHVTLDRYQAPADQIPANGKAIIQQMALALLQQKAPPASRSMGGHAWLQRRAMDVLAVLGTDPNAVILPLITGYAGDDTSPMSLRLTAARSLGYFQYGGGVQVDSVPAAQSLGALAALACRTEIDRVDELKRKQRRGQDYGGADAGGGGTGGMEGMMGGAGGMAGMMGGGGGMEGMMGGGAGGGGPGGTATPALSLEDATSVQYTRRRLKYQLYFIQLGLVGTSAAQPAGLVAAGDAQQQAEVQKVVAALSSLMTILKEPEHELKPGEKPKGDPPETISVDDLLKEVRKEVRQLEALVKVRRAGLPGPMPDPADDGAAPVLPGAN